MGGGNSNCRQGVKIIVVHQVKLDSNRVLFNWYLENVEGGNTVLKEHFR